MKDIFAQYHRYERFDVRDMKEISINSVWTKLKKEIQVQHNIENVAANEANLEAKIEKKKVMKEDLKMKPHSLMAILMLMFATRLNWSETKPVWPP